MGYTIGSCDQTRRILKALGLEGQPITDLNLTIRFDKPVTVTIKRLVTTEELDALSDDVETEKYFLTEPLYRRTTLNDGIEKWEKR